jgi:hypothetical protein
MNSIQQAPGRNYRRFVLELLDRDPRWGVNVRLQVSKPLGKEACTAAFKDASDRAARLAEDVEVDTNFWVDRFDFPLIDNTRLSSDERCAVALSQLTDDGLVQVALAYFPGSRASLKEKPYYDEIMNALVKGQRAQLQQK